MGFFSYLKFWIKSSNQHGVHSPFVFNYLTKGLYEPEQVSNNKQLNWILKSINYFNPKKIYVSENLKSSLKDYDSLFTNAILNADLIFVKDVSLAEIERLVKQINVKQLLFICNKRYDSNFQEKLRLNNEIVLVVDFYIGSLISKRTEQLKQNFFLRV